ncbi:MULTISPECIES: phiSA1p31-related protein [unclassified Streptomyces]|uniref:phiSA1p31-related protein n=1 Tax=unclassified Streptomyces TaxID=2593676 RepID=UPI0035E08A30
MSEQTFKVGDRVVALKMAHGEVTYGPVSSTFDRYTMYAVQIDGGTERMYQGADLTAEIPAFTVGDVVTLSPRPGAVDSARLKARVEYGPFDDRDIYVVKLVDPPADSDTKRTFTASADLMAKVDDKPALVPVGTRVRVDRATYASRSHGRTGVVTSNTETWRAGDDDSHPYIVEFDGGDDTVHVAELTPVDDTSKDIFGTTGFTYSGATYEYGARYRDRENDYFEFDSTLSTDGTRTPRGRLVERDGSDPGNWNWSLAEVVDRYGPLTKD